MTLEDLLSDLENSGLDLEIKIKSLSNFYYQSQGNAQILADLNDSHQIDLINLSHQIVSFFNRKKLTTIDQFEFIFFDVIYLASQLDFPQVLAITLSFDKILGKNSQRFYYLKKIAQKNHNYAQYLFNFITNNLMQYYEILYVAIASLSIFEPIKVKDFILSHFDLFDKSMDHLLYAIGYINYVSDSSALEILNKINDFVNSNELSSFQFAQILEIATHIYLKFNNTENKIINTIELISNKKNCINISEKFANLLFLNGDNLSKRLKQYFYKMLLNTKDISQQVCQSLSLTIPSQKDDKDLKRLIEVIENILLRHENISIEDFFINYITENSGLLNKLITRWLFSKNEKLWKAALTIIKFDQNKVVQVDISWTDSFKEEDYLSLTKKVIGSIHMHEKIILKFIMSILKCIKESKVADQILALVFQHAIINYNVQHIAFFFDLSHYTDEKIKKKIIDLKLQHEAFFKDIEQASILKELICPLEHSRLIQYKKYRENEKINKAADQKSAFSAIFPKTVMLYGDISIYKSIIENEEENIQESELGSFSHTLTLPLQYFTDPLLLEYQNRIVMIECMK